MHYGKINKYDVANGPGVRVSLFVSGCRNACKGCFNTQAWDFNFGDKFTDDTGKEIYEALKPEYITGLTILGGEPMEPENQRELMPFIHWIHKHLPDKSIWLYTGYTFEQLYYNGIPKITNKILESIDVMVDGKFDESLKNISLAFRGSSNQRIINVKETLKNYSNTQNIVLVKEYMFK